LAMTGAKRQSNAMTGGRLPVAPKGLEAPGRAHSASLRHPCGILLLLKSVVAELGTERGLGLTALGPRFTDSELAEVSGPAPLESAAATGAMAMAPARVPARIAGARNEIAMVVGPFVVSGVEVVALLTPSLGTDPAAITELIDKTYFRFVIK
jgi:hypothetical protein